MSEGKLTNSMRLAWTAATRIFGDIFYEPNWDYMQALDRHLRGQGFCRQALPPMLKALSAGAGRLLHAKVITALYTKDGREVISINVYSLSKTRDPTQIDLFATVGFNDHAAPRVETSANFHEFVTGHDNARQLREILGTLTATNLRPGLTMLSSDSVAENEASRNKLAPSYHDRQIKKMLGL